jgi:thiamine-phosphate pyrophosphorylase
VTAIARPCTCLVTDRAALSPEARTLRLAVLALEAFLDEATEAGVDLIQIRERDLDAAVLRDLTAAVVSRARGTATQVVVNDRVDVALAAGADGVHLRDDGPALADVRKLVGDRLIGRSIHAPCPQGRGAEAGYFVFGTVFESLSKPGGSAAGLEALAAVVRSTAAPVLAIGGMTPARARACAAVGAAGVAAIRLFLPIGLAPGSLGVLAATQQLRAAMATGIE